MTLDQTTSQPLLDVLAFPMGLVIVVVGGYLVDRYLCSPIESRISDALDDFVARNGYDESVAPLDMIEDKIKGKIHSLSFYQRRKG